MSYVIAAITIGLAIGLNPGPLGIFVIHQTLSKGIRSGAVACLAPILTDGPIVILVLLLQVQLGQYDWFLATVSVCGSIYLVKIAYDIFHSEPNLNAPKDARIRWSFYQSLKINYLNPNPYLFWLTIGGSYLAKGTFSESLIFVLCLLTVLCGTKLAVAVVIKSLGEKFDARIYIGLQKLLSIPLLIFAGTLLYSGIRLAVM